MSKLSQKVAFEIASKYQFDQKEILLGPWTSYSLLHDPKHMCFVLSRYKFCSKMMYGKNRRLEVGCGDGFGAPIVAQDAEYVLAIDVDDRLIIGNSQRLKDINNLEFKKMNICEEIPMQKFDAVFSIDVIEHLDSHLEKTFMDNSCRCLNKNGMYILGTPNITANQYATERSFVQHINLKSESSLRELLSSYFENVLVFSMNDEVIHTGYTPMAHYLFGIGIGKKFS